MRLQSARQLRTAAHVELISLIVMLTNVLTVHLKPISSLLGPTHGCAYLFVVIATWRLEQAPPAAKVVALVPGVGGLLALRQVDRADSARAQTEEAVPFPNYLIDQGHLPRRRGWVQIQDKVPVTHDEGRPGCC